jgi:hypothetical protein
MLKRPTSLCFRPTPTISLAKRDTTKSLYQFRIWSIFFVFFLMDIFYAKHSEGKVCEILIFLRRHDKDVDTPCVL